MPKKKTPVEEPEAPAPESTTPSPEAPTAPPDEDQTPAAPQEPAQEPVKEKTRVEVFADNLKRSREAKAKYPKRVRFDHDLEAGRSKVIIDG